MGTVGREGDIYLMKKFNFKRHIAFMLSAGMVFSMLAPAVPAYAASYQNFGFDLNIYNEFEGGSLPDLNSDGTHQVIDKYPSLPRDTAANGQSATSVSQNSLEMPWWDVEWDTFTANPAQGTKPAATWNGVNFNFDGYALAGWYENRYDSDPTQERVNKLPRYFPPGTGKKVYHARYVSDGTKYNFKVKHIDSSGLSVFGTGVTEKEETSQNQVLVTIQARPKVIPGLKANLNPASDISMFNPNTTVPASKTYSQYGFTVDPDNNVTGSVVNKDMEVKYTYVVDTSKTFGLSSEHVYLSADGTSIANSKMERAPLSAGASIASADARVIQPDQTAITPQNGNTQPRYLLVTADGVNPKTGTSGFGGGDVKAPYYTSGTTPDVSRYVVAHAATFESGYKIGGNMPNQALGVRYTYVPNPDYRVHISVQYVDENDQPILDLVKDKLGSSWDNSWVVNNNDNTVEFPVVPNGTANIPVPSLTDSGYGAPQYVYTSNALDVTNTTNNYNPATNSGTYGVTIGGNTVGMKITYTKDPGSWATLVINKEGSGTLTDRLSGAEYDNAQPRPISLKKNNDGTVSVGLDILPTASQPYGYEFDGYYVTGTSTKVPDTGTINIGAPYTLTAKFKQNANWKTFTFKFSGSNGYMVPSGGKAISINPLDGATGQQRVLTFTDLQSEYATEFPQVVADGGYDIKWYDQNGNEIDGNTDMAARPDGAVFTAYAVSNTPYVSRTPNAEGVINETTGFASINMLPASDGQVYSSRPDAYYAVTDEAGNIVRLIRNSDLQAANGVIGGVAPGRRYKLYELESNRSNSGTLAEGGNIADAASTVSNPPKDVTVPVSVQPQVDIDADNDRKNQVTINPVTPNTKYALLDSNGNIVRGADWTSPRAGENSITFGNLTPGETYYVVAKPASGDNTAANDPSLERLPFVASASVTTNEHKLKFVDIEVGGAGLTLSNPPADYSNVTEGHVTDVEAPLVYNGKTFAQWNVIEGPANAINGALSGRNIRVTMPRANLTLQPFYAAFGTHSDWNVPAVTVSPNVDNKNVGIKIPELPIVPGTKLRVRAEKTAVSSGALADVSSQEINRIGGGRYRGLWELKIRLEKSTDGGSNWSDYTPPAGHENVHAYIESGKLNPNREYSLYKIATASSAERIDGVIDPNWQNPNSGYSGQFEHDFELGSKYILGYITPATNRVTIKENINNTRVAQFDVGERQTVNDFRDQYASHIRSTPFIESDGVKWTYLGLSYSGSNYDPFDENMMLTDDVTVYIYYENDRDQRNSAESRLNQLKAEAEALLNNSGLTGLQRRNLRAALQEAIDALTKTAPRKSSTDELQQMISRLEAVLNDIRRGGSGNNGNSGGGGGRSGGGGGGGSSRGINTNNPSIKVGQDGDWELVDAANHIWHFKLKNGTKVKGWAKLSYSYNGTTKTEWYHFADNNVMDSGWYYDVEGATWYYLSEDHNGFFGEMKTGWYYSESDKKWYYLNPANGGMITGWSLIDGKWYYMTVSANVQSWFYNDNIKKWEYRTDVAHPYGSLYVSETTPDGYNVGSDGAWNSN